MVDENKAPDSPEAPLERGKLRVNARLKIRGDKIELDLDSPELQGKENPTDPNLGLDHGLRSVTVTCSPIILNYEPC